MTIRCLLCRTVFGCTLPLRLHDVVDGFCRECIDEQVNELEAVHRVRPAADVETGLEIARRVG